MLFSPLSLSTAPVHTCCQGQGQTCGLTVCTDAARWWWNRGTWVFEGVLRGGPRVVVNTAAFHARVRGSFPGLGGLKETNFFLSHPLVKLSIVGSLRDREVACSSSDFHGWNFESCVCRAVSSHSSHHPQEVLLAQFSLYVHKSGLISFLTKWALVYIPLLGLA